MSRFWSARFGSPSKLSCAVATAEQDAWVLFEPRFQGGGLTIRKQIHWQSSLQIDENGAIFFPAAQGELIDTQHPRRWHRCLRCVAQHPRNGHARAWQTELGAASRSGFSSQRKAKFGEGFLTAGGSPGLDASQLRKPLGENFTRTSLIWTKEATNHSQQSQRFSYTRKVLKRASV